MKRIALGLALLLTSVACGGDDDSKSPAAGGGGTSSGGTSSGGTSSGGTSSGGTSSGGTSSGGTSSGGAAGGGGTSSGGAAGAGGASSGGAAGAGGASSGGSGGSGTGGQPSYADISKPKIYEKVDDGGSASAVALDPSGTPHVAYRRTTGVVALAKRGTSGWAIDEVTGSSHSGSFMALGFASDGTPHIAFRTADKLQHASKGVSGWTVTEVSTVNTNARVDIAVDAAGGPHLAFQNLSGPQLGYAKWSGSAFATEAVGTQSGGALEGNGPSIAVSPAGIVHVATGHGSGASSVGNVAIPHATTGWEVTPFDATPPTSGKYDATDVAFDASGALHVIYVRESGILRYNLRTGATWGTPVANAGPVGNARLAVSADGAAYVVGKPSGASSLYIQRVGTTGVHQVYLYTGLDPESPDLPSIAVDASGAPHVSFKRGSLAFVSVWYASY